MQRPVVVTIDCPLGHMYYLLLISGEARRAHEELGGRR